MTTATDHPPQPSAATLQTISQLLQEVRWVLDHLAYGEVQATEIRVRQREVTLHETVSSYFLKQVAQELVKRVPGIDVLRNEVVVRKNG